MRTRVTMLLVSALVLLALPMMGATAPYETPTSHLLETVVAQAGQEPEASLPFLFAVHAITWLAFFAYAFYLTRRQGDLRREIQALRQELEQRRSPPRE